jgi:hypothetical protein
MIAIPLHSGAIAQLHLSGFGLDDFICLGLIALALVVATFVVRGGEKEEKGEPAQSKPKASVEK